MTRMGEQAGRVRRFGLARGLLVAVLTLAGAWAFWHLAVREHVVPKNFGVVEAGKVYRSGGLTPAATERVVRRHGIRTIIDLGTYEPGMPGERRSQRTADILGVERFVMDLEGDSTGNPNYYVQALRLMTDPAKQPVLVHCGAGSERTGCAVMLYRQIEFGESVRDALPAARLHRHDPGRNPLVLVTLADWGDAIIKAFRDGGQIPGVDPLPPPVPAGEPRDDPPRDQPPGDHAPDEK